MTKHFCDICKKESSEPLHGIGKIDLEGKAIPMKNFEFCRHCWMDFQLVIANGKMFECLSKK